MKKIMFLMMFLPLVVVGQDVSTVKYYNMQDVIELFDYNYLSELLESKKSIKLRTSIVILETANKKEYYLELRDTRHHSHDVYYGKAWVSYDELISCLNFISESNVKGLELAKGGEHDYAESVLSLEDIKLKYLAKGGTIKWYIHINGYFGASDKNAHFDNFVSALKDSEFISALQNAKSEIDRLKSN